MLLPATPGSEPGNKLELAALCKAWNLTRVTPCRWFWPGVRTEGRCAVGRGVRVLLLPQTYAFHAHVWGKRCAMFDRSVPLGRRRNMALRGPPRNAWNLTGCTQCAFKRAVCPGRCLGWNRPCPPRNLSRAKCSRRSGILQPLSRLRVC